MAERGDLSTPLSAPKAEARFACDITFTALATIAVALRFHCRFLTRLAIKNDDWFVVGALIFLYGLFICDMIEIFLGYAGHPGYEFRGRLNLLDLFNKAHFAGQLLYPFAVTGARLSLNFLFIRIFDIPTYRRLGELASIFFRSYKS